jgi:signal transduction histidine kinase
VNQETGWVAARMGRLSTGLKMLIILGLGLLPLGIVAVAASIYSAQDNWNRGEIAIGSLVDSTAQRLNVAVTRAAVAVRAASPSLAHAPPGSDICRRTLDRLAPLHAAPVRYAIYDPPNRQVLCASAGFAPPAAEAAASRGSRLEISPDGTLLRFFVVDEQGRLEGAGEFSRAALAGLAGNTAPFPYHLSLAQGEREMQLHDGGPPGRFQREVNRTSRVSGGLDLRLRAAMTPITAAELLMILLPLMMLIAAALIGWWIVDRLLLGPLATMQRAVAAYRPGDRGLDLPSLRSPAREIGELGQSFDNVTRTVARHEADLEAAVERQTRLVREVHHRVKNNLQVVASLLNLHARGATNEDVAAAYASIQRRVDALAVVHRNHYAELEENRGVALRSLISELAANLRATAPASAAGMQIRLDIEPFYVTQDVAVSVAFLVTELVEFGMFCGASWIAIALEADGPGRAALSIETDALAGDPRCDRPLFERFDRIVTGLARQLRSALDRDTKRGRYAIQVAVVDRIEG